MTGMMSGEEYSTYSELSSVQLFCNREKLNELFKLFSSPTTGSLWSLTVTWGDGSGTGTEGTIERVKADPTIIGT
jgi:hypothetical protein